MGAPLVPGEVRSDYQTFAGPAFAYRPFRMPDCMAVWVSWEVARQHQGPAAPLECRYRALAQIAPEVPVADTTASAADLATVEDLIFSSGGTELPAAKLCSSLEEAWKAYVDQSHVDGMGELTVAWRESWLGHWTYS
jgi:hypothetical protein